MKRRRLAVVLLVVALLAGLSASCDWSKRTVVDMGLIDSPAPAPLVDDMVCDGSRGSTCSTGTLALVLRPALTAAASRPGSIVRLWMQGSTVERTRIVWTATSVKPLRSGRRAVASRTRLAPSRRRSSANGASRRRRASPSASRSSQRPSIMTGRARSTAGARSRSSRSSSTPASARVKSSASNSATSISARARSSSTRARAMTTAWSGSHPSCARSSRATRANGASGSATRSDPRSLRPRRRSRASRR